MRRRSAPFALALAGLVLGTAPARVAPHASFFDFRYTGAPRADDPVAAPPGHYLNPVVTGSTSDPSIVRVSADYYLATSTFTWWPGIALYHSRDLVGWTRVGSALTRRAQLRIEGVPDWQGIYAPDLKWHDGRFYLVGTCAGCGGNFAMTAPRVEGPWSEPRWLPFDGIDPSLFFDYDGRAYLLNNGPPPGGPRWDGHRAIWMQELDLRNLTLVRERIVLLDGGGDPATRPFWVEGPHLLRHDGRYMLICALGGTKEHHREIAFRADRLRGPYVARGTPILTQEGLDPARTRRVVQAGHADLVETPAGAWWAVFLASRPAGPRELDYLTGRETYLLPVTWRDGWPEILPPRTAIPADPPRPKLNPVAGTEPGAGGGTFVADWRTSALGPRWSTIGSYATPWWTVGGGTLRMAALTSSLGDPRQPALIALRQADPYATASVAVRLDTASAAGLTAFADPAHYWALLVARTPDGGREVRLVARESAGDPAPGRVVARAALAGAAPVWLRIVIAGTQLRASYAPRAAAWRPLGRANDALTLAVSRTNGFTGVLIGPVVLGGAAAR